MDIENLQNAQLYWDIFRKSSDGILIIDSNANHILVANPAAASMHGYTLHEIEGFQIKHLIHAKSMPLFVNLENMLHNHEVFETLAQHVRKDNTVINVDWSVTPFSYQGIPCGLVLLRDVTKRTQTEYLKNRRMVLRSQEQATLLEISQTFAATLQLQPELILDQLKILIKYTYAGIFMLQDNNLVSKAMRGTNHLGKTASMVIRLNGKGQLAELLNDYRPIVVENMASDSPARVLLRTLLENDHANLLGGAQSWMWVPLAVKNRILGGIGVAHTETNFFTKHDAELAMTIANQAAITLVNAELHDRAQALAGLQERQRLAQNLHDAINQSLFSGGLIAEVLPRLWERDPAEALRSLNDLRHLIRGAQAEMRALLGELRPDTLTDSELTDLILLLGNAFTGRTNIPVNITSKGAYRLPSETQVVIYRMCQEALNNIAKHAKATQVNIQINLTATAVEVQIVDNGIGFDHSRKRQVGHFGLEMMYERAETIGATLKITSTPQHGTEILIHWKLAEV